MVDTLTADRPEQYASSKAKDAGEIKKEEGLPDKDGMTSRERSQRKNCISPHFPCWSNLAPLFLLQPKHLHIYTGVKWSGVKEVRYWSTQHDLQRKEQSWRLAHQFHIQGYEDKKAWAQELLMQTKLSWPRRNLKKHKEPMLKGCGEVFSMPPLVFYDIVHFLSILVDVLKINI